MSAGREHSPVRREPESAGEWGGLRVRVGGRQGEGDGVSEGLLSF